VRDIRRCNSAARQGSTDRPGIGVKASIFYAARYDLAAVVTFLVVFTQGKSSFVEQHFVLCTLAMGPQTSKLPNSCDVNVVDM
jgi:hypothetical protein